MRDKLDQTKGDDRTVRVDNPFRGGIIIKALAGGDSGGRPSASVQLVSVKISSVVSSQVGRYNAKTYSGAINTAATGALTEANLGTLASADDAIVWHTPEITLGSAKHLLKAGATYQGRVAGTTSAGLKIILVGAMPIGETGSATTLAPTSSSADSTTWSRITDGTPLTITLQTRTYYDTSSHVLSQFTRVFNIDATGLIISMSAETKATVDSATSCS